MRRLRAAVLAAMVIGTFSITQVPASAEPVGVLASYHGTTIDLGKGWADAEVCAEFAVGDVRCFRTPQEFAATTGRFGPAAAEDCAFTWVCLWENIDHTGRRLQWNVSGTKKLENWTFRDMASSAAVHRPQGGATLVNYSIGVDGRAYLKANGIYSDFRSFGWNDKADEIQVG